MIENERIQKALAWCRERNINSYNLILFDKQNKKKKAKEKIDKKEFKKMCKKARVERKALCKTIFTKNL